MEGPPSAAETRRWLEDHDLLGAVVDAAAELPGELPPRAVELIREHRRARRVEAARRREVADARTA
jgi:hypothetical protein